MYKRQVRVRVTARDDVVIVLTTTIARVVDETRREARDDDAIEWENGFFMNALNA